jgi:hypothetical protein
LSDSKHNGGDGRLRGFGWFRKRDRTGTGEQVGIQAHESIADAYSLGHVVEVLWLALFAAF